MCVHVCVCVRVCHCVHVCAQGGIYSAISSEASVRSRHSGFLSWELSQMWFVTIKGTEQRGSLVPLGEKTETEEEREEEKGDE